jgi:hypothetical protein
MFFSHLEKMAMKIRDARCDNIPKFYRYIPNVRLKFTPDNANGNLQISETFFNVLAIEQLGTDLHKMFKVQVMTINIS